MGKFRKVMAIALCALMAVPMVACGGNEGGGGGGGGSEVKVKFAVNVDQYTKAAWQEIIADYNAGQGKTDGVKIVPTYNEGSTDAQLKTKVSKRKVEFGLVALSDKQFKDIETGSNNGLFLELDKYLTEDVKTAINYNDISKSLIDRFSMNINKVTDTNKYNKGTWESGKGTSLLAMPYGDDPETLFYNKQIFQQQGINVISIAEDKLAAYNAANGTEYMPHGYAEYSSDTAWCQAANLIKHKNLKGESVYMVFNNRIPMSWEENRYLAYFFMSNNGGGYQYGYMTEWWFFYGWSVGGDCIGWDYDAKEYKFTIGDTQDNFLVIADNVTVRGNTYNKGDVMIYEDALYVNRNADVKEGLISDEKVYILPSQYEAFLEINRYGIPTNKYADVDGGRKGYGISKDTTQNRDQEFLTGTNCPMLVSVYASVNTFSSGAIAGKFDLAPVPQYRKYKDVEYDMNVTDEWKIIGKDGYTGELETANGVEIKGRCTTGTTAYALAIPKNAEANVQDAAFKFIKYFNTPEVEKKFSATQSFVPIHTSYAMSEEYNNIVTKVSNAYVGGLLSKGGDLGDWSYFQNNTWIDAWSSYLNTQVRAGTAPWTLTYFINNVSGPANDALSYMEFRLLGR